MTYGSKCCTAAAMGSAWSFSLKNRVIFPRRATSYVATIFRLSHSSIGDDKQLIVRLWEGNRTRSRECTAKNNFLGKKNLRLSSSYKPIVNPKYTTILGRTWSQGTLMAILHQIAVDFMFSIRKTRRHDIVHLGI